MAGSGTVFRQRHSEISCNYLASDAPWVIASASESHFNAWVYFGRWTKNVQVYR